MIYICASVWINVLTGRPQWVLKYQMGTGATAGMDGVFWFCLLWQPSLLLAWECFSLCQGTFDRRRGFSRCFPGTFLRFFGARVATCRRPCTENWAEWVRLIPAEWGSTCPCRMEPLPPLTFLSQSETIKQEVTTALHHCTAHYTALNIYICERVCTQAFLAENCEMQIYTLNYRRPMEKKSFEKLLLTLTGRDLRRIAACTFCIIEWKRLQITTILYTQKNFLVKLLHLSDHDPSFVHKCMHISVMPPWTSFLFCQMTSPWWFAPALATIVRSTTSERLWTMPRRTVTAVQCSTTWEPSPTSSSHLRACLPTVRLQGTSPCAGGVTRIFSCLSHSWGLMENFRLTLKQLLIENVSYS